MHSRTILFMATLVLPIFAAPVPGSQEIYKKNAQPERRNTFSLNSLVRDVIKRTPIIEAIPSDPSYDIAIENKHEEADDEVVEADDQVVEAEADATEDLAERGIIHRPGGSPKRGLSHHSGGGSKRGITRTKGNGRSVDLEERARISNNGGHTNSRGVELEERIDSSGASDGEDEDEDEDGGDVEGQGEVGVSDESSVGIETRGRVGGSGHKNRRGRVGGSGHKSRRGRVGGCGHKCRRGRVGGSGHKSKREMIDRVLSYFFN